jgi:ribonuclease T2
MKPMNKATTKALLGVGLMVCYAAFTFFSDDADARRNKHKGQKQEQREHVAGTFDYYVLALSWSPAFCASQSEGAHPQQCGKDRRFSFVVHGLWPQYDKGWPQDCATSFPTAVSNELVFDNLDMMPSTKLINHEWAKHGTCSGLNQAKYFEAARTARDSIGIPPQYQTPTEYLTTTPADLRKNILAINPQLKDDMIAVTCKDRTLQEVRVCMNKDLSGRACGANERRQCKSETLVLPPVRGS